LVYGLGSNGKENVTGWGHDSSLGRDITSLSFSSKFRGLECQMEDVMGKVGLPKPNFISFIHMVVFQPIV